MFQSVVIIKMIHYKVVISYKNIQLHIPVKRCKMFGIFFDNSRLSNIYKMKLFDAFEIMFSFDLQDRQIL